MRVLWDFVDALRFFVMLCLAQGLYRILGLGFWECGSAFLYPNNPESFGFRDPENGTVLGLLKAEAG